GIRDFHVTGVQTCALPIWEARPADIDAIRARGQPLVGFSDQVAAEHLELKRFLRDRVYRHYRVLRMTNKAQHVMKSLFDSFFARPELLPTEHHLAARQMEAQAGEAGRARAVADYIAVMTHRYAIGEYERLFDPAKRSWVCRGRVACKE